MTIQYVTKLRETANFVKENLGEADVGMILGSGLTDLVNILED